jgi:hypothetical protein
MQNNIQKMNNNKNKNNNDDNSSFSIMEKLTAKSSASAESLKSLIHSNTSEFEERLILQDSVDGIARETEDFISYLYCKMPSEKRKKILATYKDFLKDVISDIDRALGNE